MNLLSELNGALKRLAFHALGSGLCVRHRLTRLAHSDARVVLNLHRVGPSGGSAYEALDARLFEDLLIFLRREFLLTTFEDVPVDPKQKRPVAILSFDDGYKDFIEVAAPLLHKHSVRCNQNVIPGCIETKQAPLNVLAQDFIGQAPWELVKQLRIPGFEVGSQRAGLGMRLSFFIKNRPQQQQQKLCSVLLPQFFAWDSFRPTPMMSLEDIRQIQSEHEIGAHSFWHATMQYETHEYLTEDVRRCQDYFRTKLGAKVNVYAFPNGSYSEGQIELVEQAGIDHILLVEDRLDVEPRRHTRFTFHARSRSEARYRATRLEGMGGK